MGGTGLAEKRVGMDSPRALDPADIQPRPWPLVLAISTFLLECHLAAPLIFIGVYIMAAGNPRFRRG